MEGLALIETGEEVMGLRRAVAALSTGRVLHDGGDQWRAKASGEVGRGNKGRGGVLVADGFCVLSYVRVCASFRSSGRASLDCGPCQSCACASSRLAPHRRNSRGQLAVAVVFWWHAGSPWTSRPPAASLSRGNTTLVFFLRMQLASGRAVRARGTYSPWMGAESKAPTARDGRDSTTPLSRGPPP